jgi:hypothetical protein
MSLDHVLYFNPVESPNIFEKEYPISSEPNREVLFSVTTLDIAGLPERAMFVLAGLSVIPKKKCFCFPDLISVPWEYAVARASKNNIAAQENILILWLIDVIAQILLI